MNRARLPIPVREVLREPFDEAATEAALAGIRRAPRERRPLPRASVSVAAALTAACVVVVVLAMRTGTDGPLLRPDGQPLAGSLHGAGNVVLSDGSRVLPEEDAQLHVLENTDRELSLLLARGCVTFDVQPGGPRRWVIEGGLATIFVVGTRFTVERTPERLVVSVGRGAVLVRGERVPDRARRLGAGESIVVDSPQPTGVAEESPSAPAERSEVDEHAAVAHHGDEATHALREGPSDDEPAGRRRAHSDENGAEISPWRVLAEQGDYAGAWDSMGHVGVQERTRHADVDDLLVLADIARLSGHPEAAVAPLERILQRHSRHRSAAVAAFSLGRLEADALQRPARAAHAFERALSLGLARALQPDALARLARARSDAGDVAGAREAAARYLAEQPEGRHASSMRALVEAGP